jgi:nicotinamidase/pyrazinamidase
MLSGLLMIVDMQNDFVTKNGSLYFPQAEKIKPVVIDIVKDRMKRGYDLIFTKDWHDPNDLEFKRFPVHCVKETYGAEIFDDLKFIIRNYSKINFVMKKRFSAFYGTNFDDILKNLSPKNVEICGVDTNICVLYTVEELKNRDYDVVIYENGVASYNEKLHEFAISQIRDVLGAEIEKWRSFNVQQ